jgi:hypothetical protein
MAWGVCGGLSCVWYWLDGEEKAHPEKYAKTHTEQTVSDEKNPETTRQALTKQGKARLDKTRQHNPAQHNRKQHTTRQHKTT